MSSWIWIIIAAAALALILIITFRVRYELHHLITRYYEIESDKIRKEDRLRLVLLTDLHGRRYGEENCDLLERIRKEEPDLIVCAGDMVTSSPHTDFAESERLFKRLSEIADVYVSPGNHEKRMSLPDSGLYETFCTYRSHLQEIGVTCLENDSVKLNDSVCLSGLDIGYLYYRKIRRQYYPPEEMKKDLASAEDTMFNIILAHNPRFFKTYAAFGAELILAGHYHGGAVRIAGKSGIVSPQFRLFPRYSRGIYRKEQTTMIVSAGCGSHKVNLRLFNRPEVVVIDIHGTGV